MRNIRGGRTKKRKHGKNEEIPRLLKILHYSMSFSLVCIFVFVYLCIVFVFVCVMMTHCQNNF